MGWPAFHFHRATSCCTRRRAAIRPRSWSMGWGAGRNRQVVATGRTASRRSELAYLTASRLNGCGYCEHYHKGFARAAGLSDAQVQSLGAASTSNAYSEVEKLVIRFAEQWTRQGKVEADVVKALAQHLSPAQ